MKPKNNTRQLKLFSFINKVVSRKFYYSVIVRTCFQKDNYDSLIHFFILCSYSDLYIYNLTVLSLLLLLVVIGFSIFYLYYKNSKSNSIEKTLTKQSQEQKASTDAVVWIIIIIEEDYTQSSSSEDQDEDRDDEDPEDDLFMDFVHYPFQDIDIHFLYINGFERETPSLNWSIGKVDKIDFDAEGKILWVWVQIYLYNPSRMPFPFEPGIFRQRSTLSKNLQDHPISEGDFVLLEYRRRTIEEHFSNRTFFIVKILK